VWRHPDVGRGERGVRGSFVLAREPSALGVHLFGVLQRLLLGIAHGSVLDRQSADHARFTTFIDRFIVGYTVGAIKQE
jgi:hypothetical protein